MSRPPLSAYLYSPADEGEAAAQDDTSWLGVNERAPAAGPGCIGELALELTRVLTRVYDTEFSRVDLKFTQFTLLCRIEEFQPILLSDLARMIGTTPSTMTRNINVLARKGLIEESPKRTGRWRPVRLTREGQERLASARVEWLHARAAVARTLGAENVRDIERLVSEAIGRLRASCSGSDERR